MKNTNFFEAIHLDSEFYKFHNINLLYDMDNNFVKKIENDDDDEHTNHHTRVQMLLVIE